MTAAPRPAIDIVWAEDSGADQFLIQSILDEVDPAVRVAFAADGEAAVRLVAERRPKLVVLDVRMPRLSGLAALERLAKDPAAAQSKVVLFSSSSEAREIDQANALGAAAFIQKPIDFGAFRAAVRAIAKEALAVRLPPAAAAPTKATLAGGRHHVLFWESEMSLIDSVTQFLQQGARRGDGLIVLATAGHADRLRRLPLPKDTVWLDTHDVSRRIRAAGQVEVRRFADLFAQALATASQGGQRPVTCFGELVAVLQANGEGAAAAAIEAIGQKAAADHPTSLSILCSYPVSAFSTTGAFEAACGLHTGHTFEGGLRTLVP